MSAATYVYGVVAPSDELDATLAGIEQAPVRTVGDERLAALVSDLEGGALSAAREVRAHFRVLEAAARVTTVVPTRFGTVMSGDDDVRERLLGAHAATLTQLLESLAGKVQLTVKGRYDEPRMLREIVARSSAVAQLKQRVAALPEAAGYYDRIRLGELVAGEIERARETDRATAQAKLRPLAAESRVESPKTPETAFDLAFLVVEERMDAFTAAVGALAEELGDRVELEYIGPAPPYSFAEADLASEEPAWA